MRLFSRLHSAILLGLGAFVLGIPALHAVPLTVTVDSNVIDTWVQNGAGDNSTSTNLAVVAGANPKEVYIRFSVTPAQAGTGTPYNVKLRLWQKNTFTGNPQFQLYSANNNWVETMTWGAQPLSTGTLVASKAGLTAAGYLDFNLTNYVSGPGEYSFRLTTTHTLQVNFDSSNSTNKPQLQFDVRVAPLDNDENDPNSDVRSPYYWRIPSVVEVSGAAKRTRYENSSTNAANDIHLVGYFDVTKQPYGAKNDGSADATLAIQRAVNDARDSRVAVYFPSGTYKVSETIQMAQGWNDDEFVGGIRWNLKEFPCVLLGQRTGTRPKLVINTAPDAALFSTTWFNSAATPRAVLRFWSRQKSNNSPEENEPNTQYYQWIDNIDVDLSSKAGGIGIDMDAAQGTNLTNTTVTATSGYAGIFGGPGPGGFTYGVTVSGGQYGAKFDNAHCPVIINSKFTGQTVNSIVHTGRGPLTLVGVEVSGKRISLQPTSGSAWVAALNVIDSRLESTGGEPLIDTKRSVSLTNVYLKTGSTSATAIRQEDPSGGAVDSYALGVTGWLQVKEYARGVNIAQESGDTPERVQYWIGGTKNTTNTAHVITGTGTTPPSDLSAGAGNRHALAASPQFSQGDTTDSINALTTTLVSGAGTITAARLNALIALGDSRAIFIPAGEFDLSDTVTFTWNTRFFGIGPSFSTLRATATFGAKPMIASGTGTGAVCMLADLKLLLPMNVTEDSYMAWWRAGAGSTVKNVGFDHRVSNANGANRTVPLVQITNNGGGKWAGLWIVEGVNTVAKHMLVSGTTQALKFYMLNIEHCAAETEPQIHFLNAQNFDIFGFKTENPIQPSPSNPMEVIWYEGCASFRHFGYGGAANPKPVAPPGTQNTLVRLVGSGNSNYMLTQTMFQQPNDVTTDHYYNLIDNNVEKVRGDKQAVLYKRGTPPNQ